MSTTLVRNAFLVPIACYLCGEPTKDAVFRGLTGMAPVCPKHPEGIERANRVEESVGASEVHP